MTEELVCCGTWKLDMVYTSGFGIMCYRQVSVGMREEGSKENIMPEPTGSLLSACNKSGTQVKT